MSSTRSGSTNYLVGEVMNFIPPSEHQVLVFLVQIALLLTLARLLGQACRRIGQPSVVGELLAGVLLGPSIFGRLAPSAFEWLFPDDAVQSGMLFTIGWLGVMLLLVATGFETDLALIGRLGKAAVLVSIGSLVLPFAFGGAVGSVIPDKFLFSGEDRVLFSLFLATGLAISSLPVIAVILSELKLLRRNFGQLTIAAGMANDVVGWVVLGLIAGLVSTGRFVLTEFLQTLLGLFVFLAIAAALGQRIVDAVLRALRRREVGIGGWVTMCIAIAVGLGAVTQALGVEAVLGAFIGGLLLGRSRYTHHRVEEQIETLTSSLLAPIFFATAGLRIDLSLLADGSVIVWSVILFAAATASKFVGSWAGARAAGLTNREGFTLGMALNARGALGIIIAAVGLDLGVFNPASYVVIVVMAIATSVVAPPAIRWLVSGWSGTEEEQARLKREEQLAGNLVVRPGHLLWPMTSETRCRAVAAFVGKTFPVESTVTLLNLSADNGDVHANPCIDLLGDRRVEIVEDDAECEEALASQLKLGFDLIIDSVSPDVEWPDAGPLTSAVLHQQELPVLLVRPGRAEIDSESIVMPFRRILLPVSATRPSRAAAELAISFAAATGSVIKLLHVNPSEAPNTVQRFIRTTFRTHERAIGSYADPVGVKLLDETESLAREAGVRCDRIFSNHHSRVEAILEAADQHFCDLVLLGAESQEVGGVAFLGHTARSVMQRSEIGVAVIALRQGSHSG